MTQKKRDWYSFSPIRVGVERDIKKTEKTRREQAALIEKNRQGKYEYKHVGQNASAKGVKVSEPLKGKIFFHTHPSKPGQSIGARGASLTDIHAFAREGLKLGMIGTVEGQAKKGKEVVLTYEVDNPKRAEALTGRSTEKQFVDAVTVVKYDRAPHGWHRVGYVTHELGEKRRKQG